MGSALRRGEEGRHGTFRMGSRDEGRGGGLGAKVAGGTQGGRCWGEGGDAIWMQGSASRKATRKEAVL